MESVRRVPRRPTSDRQSSDVNFGSLSEIIILGSPVRDQQNCQKNSAVSFASAVSWVGMIMAIREIDRRSLELNSNWPRQLVVSP
jgi:hypothetical protein